MDSSNVECERQVFKTTIHPENIDGNLVGGGSRTERNEGIMSFFDSFKLPNAQTFKFKKRN